MSFKRFIVRGIPHRETQKPPVYEWCNCLANSRDNAIQVWRQQHGLTFEELPCYEIEVFEVSNHWKHSVSITSSWSKQPEL